MHQEQNQLIEYCKYWKYLWRYEILVILFDSMDFSYCYVTLSDVSEPPNLRSFYAQKPLT